MSLRPEKKLPKTATERCLWEDYSAVFPKKIVSMICFMELIIIHTWVQKEAGWLLKTPLKLNVPFTISKEIISDPNLNLTSLNCMAKWVSGSSATMTTSR
jgi:hypothetical protein